MKMFTKLTLAVLTLLIYAGVAIAGTDIPCDKLSAGIEVYQCKSVKREYKIGLKKDEGAFCAELEQIKIANGCVVNGLTGFSNEIAGSEKVFQKTIYAVISATIRRDATDKFELQCEPKVYSGGISSGSNIGHRIDGFNVSQMPGKDNGDRNQAWIDSLAKKGKRPLNYWVVNPSSTLNAAVQQTCILYNTTTNTKLLEFNGEIQPVQSTKVPMTGPRPGGLMNIIK